jgi:GrpB-like predicted nucleotidyltransferase (UPF0157 family)
LTIMNWHTQFTEERDRLLGVLGAMTAGGIVENIQHVGATSVSGLGDNGRLDIALGVWPFPLEPAAQQALQTLGYEAIPGSEDALEQRFQQTTRNVQLQISMVGSDEWFDVLVVRDYLRHSEAARQLYATQKSNKPQLFARLIAEGHEWWQAHHGFAPVQAVAGELEGYPHPWCISSGWALDLFVGQVSRVHHDVDVVVRRRDQLALQQHMMARGWQFVTPLNGRLEPWPPHMFLHLPRHQVHAHRDGDFIDFLISEIEHGIWQYRREPSIIQSVERMALKTADNIPFLAPELALLFKARNTSGQARPKDQQDFERVLPHLQPAQRAWLRWALLVTDPTHPWLKRLDG